MRREPRDQDRTRRRFTAYVARLRGRGARRVCYIEFGKLQLEINGMTENSMLTSPDYCRLLWPENSVPGPFVCSPNMRTTGLEISNELSKYRMITNPLECKTVMNAKYIQYQIS